jgi:hypothetical protein
VKPDIKSGSIITIFGPPYDVTVGWAEGPGYQFHGAHVSDGSFQVFADGGDGYTSVVVRRRKVVQSDQRWLFNCPLRRIHWLVDMERHG